MIQVEQTITQISKSLGISTRTLRYYEQIGLICSQKREGYAYRVYSEDTATRLSQILVLRKLRIPLKQIAAILKDRNAVSAFAIFQRAMEETDGEIAALSTIRSVLAMLVDKINQDLNTRFQTDFLTDKDILEITDVLTIDKLKIREEASMEELNKADAAVRKLRDRDVRIIYLPPASIAAYREVGDDPESIVGPALDAFVREADLARIKPDVRHFGFNAPNPEGADGWHGYEMWVTIPDDMDVPPPLVKKHFPGGMYAVHMIPFGAFEEWELLVNWVKDSEKYEYSGKWSGENMFDWLEEHLNYLNHAYLENGEPEDMQLDLMIPIRKKA